MFKDRAAFANVFWTNKLYLLLGLIAVGLGIRLFFLLYVQRVDWDGIFYLIYAQNILGGHWLEPSSEWTQYPLGFPLLVAAFAPFFAEIEQAGLLVSLLAGTALVIPVWAVAGKLGTRRTAFLAGLLVIVNGMLVRYSVAVLSEALFTLLLVCLVWFWLDAFARTPGKWYWILFFGVEMALVFARPIGLTCIWGTIPAFLLVQTARRRKLFYALGVALGVSALYFVYAHNVSAQLKAQTGTTPPSYVWQEMSRGLEEYYANDPAQTARIIEYQPDMSGLDFVVSNAPLMLRRYINLDMERASIGVKWENNSMSTAVFPLYLLPFAVLGLGFGHENRQAWIPLLGIVPYALTVPLFTADPRYYVPLVPLFLIYVALGLGALVDRRRYLGIGVTGVLVLVGVLQAYQFNFHEWPVPVNSYKEVGLWLRTHEKPSLVLSIHPAPGFYANAPFHLLNVKPLQEQLSEGFQSGAKEIVLVTDASWAVQSDASCNNIMWQCAVIYKPQVSDKQPITILRFMPR